MLKSTYRFEIILKLVSCYTERFELKYNLWKTISGSTPMAPVEFHAGFPTPQPARVVFWS